MTAAGGSSRVSLELVPNAEKAKLAELMRAYIDEMDAIIRSPKPTVTYPYFDLYWTEPGTRWPYWIRVGGINLGLALVQRYASEEHFAIEEFFVTRPHRRQGVGLAAARRLIARHPGRWLITQREANADAIAFWHRVFDGFVAYEETTSATDAVRREQRFTLR
jgi:predicted acetyltransferase